MSQWRQIVSMMSIAVVLLLTNARAMAADIHVMCPLPLRMTLTELSPLFEHASGHRLLVSYEPSKAIIGHITGGEVPDVAILTAPNIDKLSAQQQKVIELAYYEGLSQTEMAERMGETLGTVKTWVRSALKHLREELGQAVAA